MNRCGFRTSRIFADDPRPELVDVWRAEAEESVARRMALAYYEDALDFMLSALGLMGSRPAC